MVIAFVAGFVCCFLTLSVTGVIRERKLAKKRKFTHMTVPKKGANSTQNMGETVIAILGK